MKDEQLNNLIHETVNEKLSNILDRLLPNQYLYKDAIEDDFYFAIKSKIVADTIKGEML